MKMPHVGRNLLALMAMALLLPLAGWAQASGNSSSSSSKLDSADTQLVKQAAQGDMAEVELGKLAEQKAAASFVKQFAERMVNDHSQAKDQVQTLASQKGITLPTSLDAKDKATKERLSKLSGEQFDRAYMQDMVKDHTKDVNKFKQEASSAKDPDVKALATQTLPTLESHLKEAQQIAPKENKQASNKSY
jgi:putative membrane protein